MTSAGEKFGSALAKAVKGTVGAMKQGHQAPVMYRTNLRDVPRWKGSSATTAGSICRCSSLIDKKSAGADTARRTVRLI
jgi:hypothetical protein